MIKVSRSANVPDVLTNEGKEATTLLITRINNGETEFKSIDFDNKIYGHTEVKSSLILTQNYKCCFCESKIGHISYGDVEHYRPKTGWIQDNETLNKPGYYWLAYDWENLLLSCQICNQRFKKNFFPLLNPAKRSLNYKSDIKIENPIFLDPVNEDAEKFISFKEEIPVAINSNTRANVTITSLGLDRELLNDQRRSTLNKIRAIYDLAKGYPDTFPELKLSAKKVLEKFYLESKLDSTEYASMLRSFFKDNSVNF